MPASSSSAAQEAREALGRRLREIRQDAGLTARSLGRLMQRHASKVSRIEHGSAPPSEADIREWCEHCNATDQVPDLLATLRAVEGMWIEWRRMERTGLRHAQTARLPLPGDDTALTFTAHEIAAFEHSAREGQYDATRARA